VLAKIVTVRAHGHLLEWQPAIEWFRLVSKQHDVSAFQHRDDGLEPGVIRHDISAVRVLETHADVLPDLHADCALLHGGVDLMQRALRPVWRTEALHREGGSESDATGIALPQRDGGLLLLGHGREVRIVDVDGQNAEVVANRLRHEALRGAVNMHMRIDLVDAREIRQRVVTRRRFALAGRCPRTPDPWTEHGKQPQRQPAQRLIPAVLRRRAGATDRPRPRVPHCR
jgi:hypothetical protein